MNERLADSLRRKIRESAGLRDYRDLWIGDVVSQVLASIGFSKEDVRDGLNVGVVNVFYSGDNYEVGEGDKVRTVVYKDIPYDIVFYGGESLKRHLIANVTGQIVYLLVSGSEDYEEINRLLGVRKRIIGNE